MPRTGVHCAPHACLICPLSVTDGNLLHPPAHCLCWCRHFRRLRWWFRGRRLRRLRWWLCGLRRWLHMESPRLAGRADLAEAGFAITAHDDHPPVIAAQRICVLINCPKVIPYPVDTLRLGVALPHLHLVPVAGIQVLDGLPTQGELASQMDDGPVVDLHQHRSRV